MTTATLANAFTCVTVIATILAVAVVILAVLHHLACTDRRHAERRAAALQRQRDHARERVQQLLAQARHTPTQELPKLPQFAPAQVRPPGTALVPVTPTEARMPAVQR